MSRFEDIRGWAMDRSIISGSTTDKQFIKLVEECGELAHALARNNREGQIDAIGDMVVVLTILAAQNGWNIEDCIESAYETIKNRKGRMVNNVFIKDEEHAI